MNDDRHPDHTPGPTPGDPGSYPPAAPPPPPSQWDYPPAPAPAPPPAPPVPQWQPPAAPPSQPQPDWPASYQPPPQPDWNQQVQPPAAPPQDWQQPAPPQPVPPQQAPPGPEWHLQPQPQPQPQWDAMAGQYPEVSVGADGAPMIDLSEGPRRRPAPGDVILTVDGLEVYYGAAVALKGIDFEVRQGEVVVIIGANGAGKTTTMRTISGVSEPLQSTRGRITFRGRDISKLPAHKVQRLGLCHVPEGRHVFGESSVEDNLRLGSIRRSREGGVDADLARIYERFPVLGDRRNRPAGLLSGGEQQMLAISRALMGRPEVILLDEPSLGLAPIMIKAVFDLIEELANEGTTILLVEQMANQALAIADRAYVLETGAITLEGTGAALLEDERVKAAYLGA